MPGFKNLRKLNVFGMVLSCLYLGVEDGGDGPYLFPETITNIDGSGQWGQYTLVYSTHCLGRARHMPIEPPPGSCLACGNIRNQVSPGLGGQWSCASGQVT